MRSTKATLPTSQMTMFDSHCHLHDVRLRGRVGGILARARAAGVSQLLLAGVDAAGWRDEEALVREHPEAGLQVAYGLHPQRVVEIDDREVDDELAELARVLADPARVRPVALGEIGLDGLGERRASLERQERAFRAQLALARRHRLPIVLHILRQHGRALELLAEAGVPNGGVVHSYSGSAELVKDYLALGLHISFAGSVTYPNARKVGAAVRAVPAERLLLETDAPFQTPAPCRPADNEPAFLGLIAEAVARIRQVATAEIAELTTASARRLFGHG